MIGFFERTRPGVSRWSVVRTMVKILVTRFDPGDFKGKGWYSQPVILLAESVISSISKTNGQRQGEDSV